MEIIYRKYNYTEFINVACSSYCACSMKWHDYISYAWSHGVELGVCAWYWLLTILGECVVSSKIGTTSEIETHGCTK